MDQMGVWGYASSEVMGCHDFLAGRGEPLFKQEATGVELDTPPWDSIRENESLGRIMKSSWAPKWYLETSFNLDRGWGLPLILWEIRERPHGSKILRNPPWTHNTGNGGSVKRVESREQRGSWSWAFFLFLLLDDLGSGHMAWEMNELEYSMGKSELPGWLGLIWAPVIYPKWARKEEEHAVRNDFWILRMIDD